MEKDTKGLRYACLYQDCEGLLPNASVYLKGEEILSWHFIRFYSVPAAEQGALLKYWSVNGRKNNVSVSTFVIHR